MRKIIDVEELISKIYDPRVVHMDEHGRVKREEVIMVINGLAEEGDRDDCFIDDVPWSCPLLRKVTNEKEAKEYPIMKKKDADRIAEAFKRLHCDHEWVIHDDCEKFIARCKKCGAVTDSRFI